jgi:lysophospholipase L1-like esterase
MDSSDPAGPVMGWPASSLVARFTGTSLGVRLREAGMGSFLEVLLDGRQLPKLATVVGQDFYPLVSGLGDGPHEVMLFRRTEAYFGETQFLGFVLSEGGRLLSPPSAPARRIEFIGDSITCGFGLEEAGPCAATAANENAYAAYAAITTRTLSAESQVIAFSGRGIFRNLDGTKAGTMPELYEQVLPGRQRWDFNVWSPHVVVINLGTNDIVAGDDDPGQALGDAYLALLRRIRSNYAKAPMVLTMGPMLGPTQAARLRKYVVGAMDTLQGEGDANVTFLEFAAQVPADGYGCAGHPSPVTHQMMADLLVGHLRAVMGW